MFESGASEFEKLKKHQQERQNKKKEMSAEKMRELQQKKQDFAAREEEKIAPFLVRLKKLTYSYRLL